MSLVVGAIENGDISLSCDTKLTPGAEWAIDQPKDGLKVFFIDREVCIAYSGSIRAQEIICDVAQFWSKKTTVTELLAFIAKLRLDYASGLHFGPNQTPDFIVAIGGPSPELFRIAGDHLPVHAGSLSCVGDPTAISRFRTLFAGGITIKDALSQIIQDPEHPTVGGFPVTARTRRGRGFNFVCEMMAIAGGPPQTIPHGESRVVNFGTAATGGFACGSVVPVEPGKNGYGLYFYQGESGFFYDCDLFERRFKRLTRKAKSASGFAKMVGQVIGYDTIAIDFG